MIDAMPISIFSTAKANLHEVRVQIAA